ncbi:MAG: hypothetical protein ACJ8CR_02680, partial [Roseiflexaceae bacterium]
ADDRHFPPEMFVESEPYAPGAAVPTATLGVENQQQIQERQAMAAAAEAIPYRRGLYVGHVGKAARRR